MEPTQIAARTAGRLYLFVVLACIFSLAYLPSKMIHRTDSSKTYEKIQSSESLFLISIVAGVTCYPASLGEIGSCLCLRIIGKKIAYNAPFSEI